MRKLLNVMAIIGLTACAVVGFAPSAQAAAENSPGQICKEFKPQIEAELSAIVGQPVTISTGTCVNLITAAIHENGAQKVASCKFLLEAGIIPESSLGACMSEIKDAGPTNWSVAVFAVLLGAWGLFRFGRRRKSLNCAA